MAITNVSSRWYESSDSDDDDPGRVVTAGVKGRGRRVSPLKLARERQDDRRNSMGGGTPHPLPEAEPPRMRRSSYSSDEDEDGLDDDDHSSASSVSPTAPGDTPSPYAHLSRLGRARAGAAAQTPNSLTSMSVPAWSPGLRGRTARNREVLLVARNAREQAKENEFLRTRVRELEEEIAVGAEQRMLRVKAALEAGERAVEASAGSVRQLEDRLEGAKQREVALTAEAAAHAAAAEQLTLELERMRAIEEQTSLEAAALIQKTSRLQNELNASARQAAIAEEMLAGVQVEGDRALEASEHAMMELQRRLRELEAEESNDNEQGENEEEEGGGASSSKMMNKRGRGAGGGMAGDLAALLDQAMGEAAALREAVASAASEAGRWRAEASRMEKEHGATALERSYEAAMVELKELREENAFLRSDLMALHSGMVAEEEAMNGSRGGVTGDGQGSAAGDVLVPGGADENAGKVANNSGNSGQPESGVGGGGGGGVNSGGGSSTPGLKGDGSTPALKGVGRFASPSRSSFKKQLRSRSCNMSLNLNPTGQVLDL